MSDAVFAVVHVCVCVSFVSEVGFFFVLRFLHGSFILHLASITKSRLAQVLVVVRCQR